MLARKKTSLRGKMMPQDWVEGLSRLLNETYKNECQKAKKYFDISGQIFKEEMLLTVSYLSEDDQYVLPITLFLSAGPDQMINEAMVKETQKNFIDLIGLFFDEIFADSEWNNFEESWQEVTVHKINYFYKVSRENVNLTLEANKLLGDEFLENDLDDGPDSH
jgi:hypothetical protein